MGRAELAGTRAGLAGRAELAGTEAELAGTTPGLAGRAELAKTGEELRLAELAGLSELAGARVCLGTSARPRRRT